VLRFKLVPRTYDRGVSKHAAYGAPLQWTLSLGVCPVVAVVTDSVEECAHACCGGSVLQGVGCCVMVYPVIPDVHVVPDFLLFGWSGFSVVCTVVVVVVVSGGVKR